MLAPSLIAHELSEIIRRLEYAKQCVTAAPKDAAIVTQGAAIQLSDMARRLGLPNEISPLEDLRMGHVRLDECTGCPPGPLYDRISFVLQRAADRNAVLERKLQLTEDFIKSFTQLQER